MSTRAPLETRVEASIIRQEFFHSELIREIKSRIAWHSQNTNDPHGITTAVIASLHEVLGAIESAKKASDEEYKPTSRKPSPKATKCWANVLEKHSTSVHFSITAARNFASLCGGRTVPAYLITQEQIEACVEAMARAIHRDYYGYEFWSEELKEFKGEHISMARAALRAAGVK